MAIVSDEQVIKVLRQYNPWWRNSSTIKEESSKVANAFLITKKLDDFGIAKHETATPILRVPAIAFLYLLGKAEEEGQNGKM